MQRSRILFSWILLIYSIINFTLAAPIGVRDIHGVRVNVADVAENRIEVLQKRMDPDEGQSSASDLTSEHKAPAPPVPEPDSEMESESESESELESDSDDSDDSDGGEAAQQWEEEFQNYEPSDIEEESQEEDDSEEEEGHELSPPPSPEVQHPAAFVEDLWNKLFSGSLRPRTSTLSVRQRS